MIKHGIYRHFKGGEYEIVCEALNEADLEPLVIYQALYDDHKIWARPCASFEERVEFNNEMVSRFTFVREA